MILHLLKSLNNKKSGRNNLTFSSISLGQNCLFVSFSSLGGLDRTSRRCVHPPSATGHLASWHLTGNLFSSQSVIPQSHYHRGEKKR